MKMNDKGKSLLIRVLDAARVTITNTVPVLILFGMGCVLGLFLVISESSSNTILLLFNVCVLDGLCIAFYKQSMGQREVKKNCVFILPGLSAMKI